MPPARRPKVLCIRLSAMGDLVVTTPVLRALDEQLGAEVHLLTRAPFAPVVAHNPHVHRLHLWDATSARALRREGFALVVDLHGSIRSHLLRLRLGVRAVGFRKRNLEKALLARGIDLLGGEHLLDRYFRALAPLGVGDDGRGLEYVVTEAESAAAEAHLGDFGRGPGGERATLTALVLGATHFTKRMPPELVAAVVAAIDGPVVLLGGPDVVGLGAATAAASAPRHVLDLCGRLPLRESIAVLAKADGVVTGDTGLMHVAAALGKPIVVVWGNTAPAIGMFPWLPRGRRGEYANAEVSGLGCRPCSRIGYAACPRGHFRCMRDQDAGGIARQLAAVVGELRGAGG